MNTAGSYAYQHIPCLKVLPCDDIFFVYHAHSKARNIVFLFGHESRMLCGLTAYQRSACHLTAHSNALYDLCDLLRIVLAACNIIQEKQGFSACAGNVVHAHGNCVNAYGIMFVQDEGQFDLSAYTVGSR